MHHNGVGVHDGPAGGPSPTQLHGAVGDGDGTAGRAVVPGVRQHRLKVPQGRRGDHGVHVGGRQRERQRRRRLARRLVHRDVVGRQELRVPAVRHVHGVRVPVRVAGVQGVQEVRIRCRRPSGHRARPDAPVFPARSADRERHATAQIRQAPSHDSAVNGAGRATLYYCHGRLASSNTAQKRTYRSEGLSCCRHRTLHYYIGV